MAVGDAAHAFRKGCYPYCRRIAADNAYGQLLFHLWEMTIKTPFLLEAWKHSIRSEMEFPSDQGIHMLILWERLTGDELYKDLAYLFHKRPAVRGLLIGLRQTA